MLLPPLRNAKLLTLLKGLILFLFQMRLLSGWLRATVGLNYRVFSTASEKNRDVQVILDNPKTLIKYLLVSPTMVDINIIITNC